MPTKTRRKAVSAGVRFAIFKRDLFTCQYCGAHPPAAILHVDHIIAVAKGGCNDDDNLVTACSTCNGGKGSKSLTDIPESLADRAKTVAEREKQLIGYQSVMQAKRDRIEAELWRVAEEIKTNSSTEGMDRKWTYSIRSFLDRLGFDDVFDAAQKARGRLPAGGSSTFRYFCGICWSRIKEQSNG
jgi:hypothetical protein